MISIIVASILCAIALYVLDAMSGMFPGINKVDLFSLGVVQTSSFLFILFMLYVLFQSMHNMTQDWLQNEKTYNESYILASYERVMNYEEEGGRKQQAAIAGVLLIIAGTRL